MTADTVILRDGGAHFSVDRQTTRHALPWVKVIVPLDGGRVLVDAREATWSRLPVVTRANVATQSAVEGPSWTLFFPPEIDAFRVQHATDADPTPVDPKRGRALIAVISEMAPTDAELAIAEAVRVLGRGQDPTGLDPRVQSVKQRIIDWAAQAQFSQISIERLALEHGLSASRLSHLFRAQLGIPPKRYALFRRLVQAYALRAKAPGERRASPTLARVSAEAGFSDQAHLSRTARRFLGRAASVGGTIISV